MSYGRFSAAHEAVKTFIADRLMAASLSTSAPDVLNISDLFNSFLKDNDFGSLRASEETQKQESLILRNIEKELVEWRSLGVPTPIDYVESNSNILLTWRHSSFQKRFIDDVAYQTGNFIAIYDWLLTLHERDFLFVCALYMKLIGCNPILITDGSGDMGIDCIGRISKGPLRSLVVFVQSKTVQKSQGRISENTLRQEYAKYTMLRRSEKYLEYLKKLSVFDGRDGSGEVYFVVTNGEFGSNAQESANRMGIALRSKRQMAFFFSVAYEFEHVKEAYRSVTMPTGPDLDRNFAEEIELRPARVIED